MDVIALILGMNNDLPEDSKFKQEVELLQKLIIQLYIVSSNKNLHAYTTAIESLQECGEIIEETLDVVNDKSLSVFEQDDTIELMVNVMQDSQEFENN